jgi:hypothetical protein
MQHQGNAPDASMWLAAAELSAAALHEMVVEQRQRGEDAYATALQLQQSIRAAIAALDPEEA